MSDLRIMTMGSRGDVQPYLALALGLQQAGHAVTLATGTLYEDFIRGYGVNFHPLDDEYIRLAESPELRKAMENGGASLGLIRKVKPMIRSMLADTIGAAEGADAIIYHPKVIAGSHLGEKLDIPHIMAVPLPIYSPTSSFPSPILRPRRLPGFINKLTHQATRIATLPYNDVINDFRSSLGLKGRRFWVNELGRKDGSLAPVLYCYSPHVLPTPDDWADNVHVTGYWNLPEQEEWQPPLTLADFLADGEKPVYIGFGSLAGSDPASTTRVVLEAIQAAGVRAILATGWGGLEPGDVPETVHVIEKAPHSWLFQQVQAVVHHGGAGTTAAGLHAGLPTVICPFFGDQPFWGNRVYALGVGTVPIPQKELTAENLSEALRTVTQDQNMRQRASAMGEKLQAEDGVGIAVKVIEGYLAI